MQKSGLQLHAFHWKINKTIVAHAGLEVHSALLSTGGSFRVLPVLILSWVGVKKLSRAAEMTVGKPSIFS